jgi:hypothetical protein
MWKSFTILTKKCGDLPPRENSPLPVDFVHNGPTSQMEKISPVENVENFSRPTFYRRGTSKIWIIQRILVCKLLMCEHPFIRFFSTHPYISSLLGSWGRRERGATKAFLDRNIRAFAVCSATLRDWKASRLHAPTVMEVCSLRFRASC